MTTSINETIQALLSVDLPGGIETGQLPDEIMWMPPGRHTIQAIRSGKPAKVDVTVDEEAARKVSKAHREYMAGVSRNEEDHPYFDENHEDRDATAHPISFRWGGDDPQRGGIRAKVAWTDRGKQALLGRNYRRFSPSFYLDDEGKISGAPVNMGGLVNRAAFKRIAPVVSKEAEFSALFMPEKSFEEKATIVARARNLSDAEAVEILARERPDLYIEYRTNLGLGDHRYRDQELAQARDEVLNRTQRDSDEFFLQSKALADALDISFDKAVTYVVRAKPALYERYRCRMMGLELRPEMVSEAQSRAIRSPFFIAAEAIAAARGIDRLEAFEIVARENPDLYDQFHTSL
jgi:hypothetical protein